MNKWSLLLFSVLGLLLSTTSEPNFVDGRFGGTDRSSRSLFAGTRLSISDHCTYHSLNVISRLTSSKRDIRHATKNVEVKRSSCSDGRGEQFEDRQNSSEKRLRSLNNGIFDLEGSNLFNIRNRKARREINDVQLRRNLKYCSRDYSIENNVDQSRSRNDDYLWNKMERNSRERGINIDNRFCENDRPLSVNLKDLTQERFSRRTFVISTDMIPHTRENIVKNLQLQKNEGKRDMERSNLDINTRHRFFRNSRISSDSSRNSNRRYSSMPIAHEIDILRNGNIRDYQRLSGRYESIKRIYERIRSIDVRRTTDIDNKIIIYRPCYDEDVSKEILEKNCNKNVILRVQNERVTRLDRVAFRTRYIQRESLGSENRIRGDKSLLEKRYLTAFHRLQRHINKLQKVREARLYNDLNIEEISNDIFIRGSERASDHSRNSKIRDNDREIRLSEQFKDDRISLRIQNGLREKRTMNSNINSRRSVLERRERDESRSSLDYNLDRTTIRKIRVSHDEEKLYEARNIQLQLIRNNAMGNEINTIRQIYDDDHFSEEMLVRDDSHRKLERLSRTNKRASRIKVIQQENENRIHSREKRIRKDPNFIHRVVSSTTRNLEKRQVKTYNEKSDREEFRNSKVRETERTTDESRISQVISNNRREYRLNAERIAERDLTHFDRNRKNVLERDINIISRFDNNRFYGLIQRAVPVLTRRENYEFRYWPVNEDKRVFERRIINVRREVDLGNERLIQQNYARRNSMKNTMLNYNRRSSNDENQSQVFKYKNERTASDDIFSSYLRMVQRENENNMLFNNPDNEIHNERHSTRRLARQDSDMNRIVEDRQAGTPNEKWNSRHSFDERKMRQLSDSRDYRLYEKLNAEQFSVRNVHNIIENRESKIRPQFDVRHRDQNTKRTPTSLQFLEKDVLSLNERVFEQSRNGIVRNSRVFTRNEMGDLRHTKERSKERNEVTMRYVETNAELYDETYNEPTAERVIRNKAIYETGRTTGRMRFSQRSSINKHNLQVGSERQRDVYRELKYTKDVSYDGLENSAQNENRDNDRKSDRNNNRRRVVQDRTREVRASNSLQIFKKDSRLTKRRTNEEREMRTAFSKIKPLPIEHKTESDIQVFDLKLQYIFYLLQGLYILGLFTKSRRDSKGIQRTGFSNWFPLLSTLKVD